MKDNIAPEEKLLRLIKGGARSARAASAPNPAGQSAPAPDAKPKGLKMALPAVPAATFIMIAAAGALLYFLCALVYPFFASTQVTVPEVAEEEIKVIQKVEPSQKKPLDQYLKEMSSRSVFGREEAASGDSTGPAKIATAELVKNLNLVGIISGNNPQAVIQDQRSQKRPGRRRVCH
jgi:hypothetical protein